MEEEIINHIYKLIYSNLYAPTLDRLETALKNRFIGFRSEIEFIKLCKFRKLSVLNGGFILPLRTQKKTLSAPLYFTVDSKEPSAYKNLYSVLNNLNFSKLMYIKFDDVSLIENWDKTSPPNLNEKIPIPKFKVYDYQGYDFMEVESESIETVLRLFTKKKEKFIQNHEINVETESTIKSFLKNYSKDELLGVYVSRLVFDGYIGMNYYKGHPSDIDLIVKVATNEYKFYEIKEKDLSKTDPIGFGIDIQRLDDCLTIAKRLASRYIYIVRQINNQQSRDFLAWRFIDFTEFEKHVDSKKVKEGGTGMNTLGIGRNPTFVIEEKYFNKI